MSKYDSCYYCLPSGRVPVKVFVDRFNVETYRKFIFKKELLEEFGPRLPMPHTKHVGKGLYELRVKGADGEIRLFYFFMDKNTIIFLHGYNKKSNKISRKELKIAYKRMTDHTNRGVE
ncbi:MAG: type II toxin-antitoxin system RelE/ParE family toxin [Candidatus Omnitrophota bacterium]